MRTNEKVFCALFTLLLAISIVGAGFAAVAVPDSATTWLSRQLSGTENPETPFTNEELGVVALAGKVYTFDDNDRSALKAAIDEVNRTAMEDDRIPKTAKMDETRSFNDEAISHLDDVYRVVSVAKPVLVGIAVACALVAVGVGVGSGKRTFGNCLVAAGCAVIVLLALVAAAALINFNGFFALFHSLFFSAGSWYFDPESLLITCYPTSFWMGMATLWCAASVALSLFSIIIGFVVKRS